MHVANGSVIPLEPDGFQLAKLARMREPLRHVMKTVGIIFLVLGLGGLGGGMYGMTQEQAARDTIAEKQDLLREAAPGLEDLGLDLNDIADLVAIDRVVKDDVMLPDNVRNAAWDILNAMGDEEDMAMAKLGGFAAGGGLLVIGLLLFLLGGRKKSAAVP